MGCDPGDDTTQISHVSSATGSTRSSQPPDSANPGNRQGDCTEAQNAGDGSQDHLHQENSAADQARPGQKPMFQDMQELQKKLTEGQQKTQRPI